MNEKKTKLSDEELDEIALDGLTETEKNLYRINRGRLPIPKNHVEYNASRGEVMVNGTKINWVLYTAAGLRPTDLRASPAMLQMLQAGYENTLGTMHNLTLTTANTAQQAYISACDLAMLQVQSGAMSYQQAIRAAIQSAASDGTRVLYPSGRTDRIEVAVRRAVLTGVPEQIRAKCKV